VHREERESLRRTGISMADVIEIGSMAGGRLSNFQLQGFFDYGKHVFFGLLARRSSTGSGKLRPDGSRFRANLALPWTIVFGIQRRVAGQGLYHAPVERQNAPRE
jgi:hypothetical protein